jgi:long-chain acyl-CoA synthetase
VFARWVRKRLGLRDVRRIACLGAVRDDLVPFYWSLGVGVSELYAKAALGGLLAARSTLDPGLSAVPGVELREEADGELAVHTPWGAPGWQRTGDRGDLGAAVIGRLEETVVLPGGGIVAIGQIERAVAASPYVARAVAAMDGLGGVTVVVEPDFETIAMWRHRLDLAQVVAHRVVEERVLIERVEADVRQAIAALSIPFELRRVRLIGRELDVARDELTPLGTVRRRRVQEEFDEEPPMRSIAAR